MTLHLRLWKDGDPANATDHPFEQEVVGIGRDPSNAMQLERPNVSKNHARIEQRTEGLTVIDLKSRNGTYVNGVRISPENPHLIGPGDKVRVCDFNIEVVAWDRPASPGIPAPRAVPSPEERPPLFPSEEGAGQPALAASSITEDWKQRVDAAERECERLNAQAAVEAIAAEEKSKHLAAAEEECRRLRVQVGQLEENIKHLVATEEECGRWREEAALLKEKLTTVVKTPPPVQHVDESTALKRLKAVLEIVLQPALKIMRGRILFRSEFTGATMFQDPVMEALSKQTPKEWISFFLDAEVSEAKARDRLERLSGETEEMIPHVIGLLDGYRKSVDVGTKNMLKHLNPARIREELFRKPLQVGPLSIPYPFLPLVADRIAWKAMEQHHRELEEEDRGNLEQRFFRPAFIQGYISCISSAKHEPLLSRSTTPTSTKAKP